MTRFQFRLQKVMEWREKQLDMEEAIFKRHAAEVTSLERARDNLAAAATQAELQLHTLQVLDGSDLSALAGFQRHVQTQRVALALQHSAAQQSMAKQQEAMLEARRRCRLLERLKQRRLGEWEKARDRELDEVASESYLAGWARNHALEARSL
jgi:flagellar export protein FliJ